MVCMYVCVCVHGSITVLEPADHGFVYIEGAGQRQLLPMGRGVLFH